MDVRTISGDNCNQPLPPAAGQFGIERSAALELRIYRPAGCPSMEQFEARFQVANDRVLRPGAA
jgi:hypothetical protein